jgi:nicotinamidase-related amidase
MNTKSATKQHTGPALLLVDVQTAFDDPSWGPRNNRQAESNIARLLATWRAAKLPVIHVRHCSIEPNSTLREDRPGNAFKPEAMPIVGEIEFKKSVNSAFIGTSLHEHLQEHGLQELVMVGISTDHCVSTTTRMAGNLGYTNYLVEDACATFDRIDHQGRLYLAQDIHDVHLASLNGEFCTVVRTDDVIKKFAKAAI